MSNLFNGIQKILLLTSSGKNQSFIEECIVQADIDPCLKLCNDKKSFQEALIDNKPDIIIADYHMPNIYGFEILATCRNICPEIPFIFILDQVDMRIIRETVIAEADAFVKRDKLSGLVHVLEKVWINCQLRLTLKAQQNRILELKEKLTYIQKKYRLQSGSEN
ncbi:MAG: response regulator [Bacteroidota bacterium]